jgi:methyl-accepting chemotaxis protein
MAVNAESAPKAHQHPPSGGPPKRQLRNYLLDARFQLKYTGYVVLVTLLVASVLGFLAYRESRAQTEMMSIGWAMEAGPAEDTQGFIEERAREYDRNMLMAIVGGILTLTIALGFMGIFITHRVVGPAFKLRRLLQHIASGHLSLGGRLRKGDELQDVFLALEQMIENLRERQREEIALLEQGIESARQSGASDTALRDLDALRDRMEKALK